MFSTIGAILAIGFLIIVHEAGHFIVARWCKMRVERFSLGFGPPLLKWRRGNTDFTLGPIPFGGFVQIDGMVIAEEVDPDDKHAYPNRPVWQRFATIFAGPATNYLAAVVLAFVLYIFIGVPASTSHWVVANVPDASPSEGLLQEGDVLLALYGEEIFSKINGENQPRSVSLSTYVNKYAAENPDKPLVFSVLRDGQEFTVEVTAAPVLPPWAQFANVGGAGIKPTYRIGIGLDGERVPTGVFASIGHALTYPVRQTKTIVVGLYRWAMRDVEGEVTSVVGITAIIKDTFEYGWARVFELLMLLNVYLGLVNLLPLPALDGGRLAFLGYEMATRRRANPKVEAMVHMVGIMALMVLMVLVTYKDIARLVTR